MPQRVRLVVIAGIPIEAEPSFFILCPIVAAFFYQYFVPLLRRSTRGEVLTISVVAAVLFIGSLLIHELAHAAVARQFGLAVRTVRLFIFGGVTDIATLPMRPRQELCIALAGPVATLMVSGVMLGLSTLATPASILGMTAGVIGRINLYLMLLNMVPVFPFDGGRALRAVLWKAYGDYSRANLSVRALAIVVAYMLIIAGACLFLLKMVTLGAVCALVGWRLHNLLASRPPSDSSQPQQITAG